MYLLNYLIFMYCAVLCCTVLYSTVLLWFNMIWSGMTRHHMISRNSEFTISFHRHCTINFARLIFQMISFILVEFLLYLFPLFFSFLLVPVLFPLIPVYSSILSPLLFAQPMYVLRQAWIDLRPYIDCATYTINEHASVQVT